MNGSPSSKFLFACGARTCHFPSLRCSEWSGWRRVCVFPSSREPTRRQTLASPSRTAAYLLPKTPSGRLWLECRPELRSHGVGGMRAVERLRNGGVPRNSIFLMPATHSVSYEGVQPLIRFLLGTRCEQGSGSYPEGGLCTLTRTKTPYLSTQSQGRARAAAKRKRRKNTCMALWGGQNRTHLPIA